MKSEASIGPADGLSDLPRGSRNDPARLRALRYILGCDNKPLSGEKFASLAGMRAGTLRAVETGLRTLNGEDETKITDRLGAIWREEKNGWFCVTAPEAPFTNDFHRIYASALDAGCNRLQVDTDEIILSMGILEKHVSPETYRSMVLAVHRHILNFAKASALSPKEIESIEVMRPLRMVGGR
jgi:hypothetical protein